MNRKGVCYDVGRVLEGSLQRPKFDSKTVHRELEIIKNDLHCNSVRIQGLDIDRLKMAAEDALKQGLEVWFSPEMFEKSQEETFEYLVNAAKAAESLRPEYPKIIVSLGSELTLFMQGIMEGKNLMERMSGPSFRENVRAGKHNKPLNDFLVRANAAVREVFQGKVTYFSLPFETVDWNKLDFVGVDLYRNSGMKEMYDRTLRSSLMRGKPALIGEFGCCTYQGAEKLGGEGWEIAFGMMADYLGPKVKPPAGIADVLNVPTRVDGHYVRDEGLQARELTDQLSVLDAAGVDGAFVFTFVSPLSYYNEDPRFDSDMPSYSLVKSYPEKEGLEQITQQTAMQGRDLFGVDLPVDALLSKFAGNVGRHGEKYPDMTWDPKQSFAAVSEYYTRH
ncbi:MAG: abortive infection protein [Nitrososphaerales archaeon]